MLTVSRKEDEKIVIGNDIEIVVVHIGGGRVTLAIQAPPHVKILRGELVANADDKDLPKMTDLIGLFKDNPVDIGGDW